MSLLAIVGRPNVGKSTLFNRLVGMRQAIVDETAGVTRDRHYGRCEWCGTEFSVVDTGGYTSNSDDIFEEEIRKQVVLAIEEANVVLFMVEAGTGDLLDAIVKELPAEDPDTDEHSDVCILMIDAQTGIEAQDMAIFNLIQRNKKGCVVVVNKWDTVEKDSNTMKEYTIAIKERLAPFNDLPIIFTSVINKQRIMDVLDAAAHVYENYSRKISTSKINEEMLPEIENYPPPAWKGKYIKIKYITQLP